MQPTTQRSIERILQTFKTPFYKVLNGKQFIENELHTLPIDIEAASNMSPLTVTSKSTEDSNIIPFTSCHLTIGDAIKPSPKK